MAYKVQITDSAENDLDEILNYISNVLCNKSAAQNLYLKLSECFELLAENPNMYPVCYDKNLAKIGYRNALINNYFVFYLIDEENQVVNVMRIIYAKRDFAKLF